MKQQEVFNKIGIILKELKDQYEYLGKSEEYLNDLELELFVANAHFLSEHSEILRKLNLLNNPPKAEEQPQKEEKFFEPVVQHAKPEAEIHEEAVNSVHTAIELNEERKNIPVPQINLTANGADDDLSYARKEPEVIKHELVLDESELWEDEDDAGFEIPEEEETAPIPKVKPEPVKAAPVVEVKKEEQTITAVKEKTAEETLTIHQRISAQLNKAAKVTEQLHSQPITDLKQAINLNDKLLYIKDLFNGYNLAYSEAVDILNRFSSFEEAEDFLKKNYAVKNHWDNKQTTADKFYELLKRRYL